MSTPQEVETKPKPQPLDSNRIISIVARHGKTYEDVKISYTGMKVLGQGRYGTVFSAKMLGGATLRERGSKDAGANDILEEEDTEIAIKKYLQDKRFKNTELEIMKKLESHPNVIDLKAYFYTNGEKEGDIYLCLILEYVPETLYSTCGHYANLNQAMPKFMIKLYMYQLLRALAHIHSSNIAHRDISTHNILLDPAKGILKLCDFGSATIITPDGPGDDYFYPSFYQAPELLLGAEKSNTKIDIWAAGCVMAEMLFGKPLFPGDSPIDQLKEIMRVLGSPDEEEVKAMNPSYDGKVFPQIEPQPFETHFRPSTPSDAIDSVAKFVRYTPADRLDANQAMAHEYFDELKVEGVKLPSGRDVPGLFDGSDGATHTGK